jgi:hypothetical protein
VSRGLFDGSTKIQANMRFRLFEYLGSNASGEGPLVFSASQQVTVCGGQPSILSFWAYYLTFVGDSCSFQACVGSTCEIIKAQTTSSNKGYINYSLTGPTYAKSTTITVSVSANGGSQGNCNGFWIIFDDFSIL